nr:MAG TPA: hypothetical protein [Herelleviridae sp.]
MTKVWVLKDSLSWQINRGKERFYNAFLPYFIY